MSAESGLVNCTCGENRGICIYCWSDEIELLRSEVLELMAEVKRLKKENEDLRGHQTCDSCEKVTIL
jgi:hypothetical protein